jgi:hypothetical protein
MAFKKPNRRQLLGGLGLGMLGVAGAQTKEEVEAVTGPTLIVEEDRQEYTRLRQLKLDDPKVVVRAAKMPVGRIGDITFGRLISGSNLISMNMHARDLDYVNALAARYNTEERILMTLKRCEEHGINGIVLKNHNFRQFKMSRYWDEWGGRMKWLADVITTDIEQYQRLVEEHLELGASAIYLWGGASDTWWHKGQKDNIVKACEIMRKYDVPVGICAHRLEPIQFCVQEGLKPDFYMITLHHDRYWSAHPKENRRFIEMFEAESPDHQQWCDNMFCHEHEKTVEFMQDVETPWIAFKVLAAGAIKPEDGLNYAFQSGADFVCLGMFDWQVSQDAEIAIKAIAGAKSRRRKWC